MHMDTFLNQTASFEQKAGFGVIEAEKVLGLQQGGGGGGEKRKRLGHLAIPVGLHKRPVSWDSAIGLTMAGGYGSSEPMVAYGGAVPDDLFQSCIDKVHQMTTNASP
jgi:hypothetical protein